jgi:hypothetical protein
MGVLPMDVGKMKLIGGLIMAGVMLQGCAGRQANTISMYMPGDRDRSCESLHMEMSNINNSMNRKLNEKNKTLGKNVVMGVAGAWLLVPWFFMDFSGTEKAEHEAFKNRYDYLGVLLAEGDCGPYQSRSKTESGNEEIGDE